MENELQLVSYEQAVKLKELGFDWEVRAYYGSDGIIDGLLYSDVPLMNYNGLENRKGIDYYSSPTVALALKYFRDIKNVKSYVYLNEMCNPQWEFFTDYGVEFINWGNRFKTYEEAESKLLDRLLIITEI